MITKIEMFGCECDNCSETWIDSNDCIAQVDKVSIMESVEEDEDWYVDGDKHYCPNCWHCDENDNLIIKQKEVEK